MLTQERLKELFYYNPETGDFTRLVRTANNTKVGDIAGSLRTDGYLCITIDFQHYYSHRLAVLYMTGLFPENDIDHINGIKHDNKWLNLRKCNDSQNKQNQKKAQKNNNSTRLLGVYPHSSNNGTFVAQIKLNRKSKYLGIFKTKEEAHQKYLEAKRKLHEFNTL